MKIEISNVGVDAGIIMICDRDYYKEYNYREDKKVSKEIKIKNGLYEVNWSIPNTWNGNINGNGTLKVTSGLVIVSDPCYCIGDLSDGFNNDGWTRWLDDTDYGDNNPDGCIVINKMGGDGTYDVHLEIIELGSITMSKSQQKG